MKIGLICPYNLALGGAVQEIVKESARELRRLGHDAVIITPTPQQGERYDNGCRIIYLGKAVDSKALGTVAQVSVSVRPHEIEDMLEREQFDILHMHEPWVPLLNGQILARATCPVVATFHAKLPDSAAAKALTAFGRPYTVPPLKYLDAIVAVSEAAAEHVRLLTKQPVYIIPNAVMIEDFRPKTPVKPNAKKTLLYVGRLEERKGVAHLIAAYKQLRETDKNVRLIIAGDGVQRAELEEMVQYEDINDVTFLGYISDAKKKQLMRSVDLFVAPAVFGESFGIVIIEALASGQVLVVGDNEGYRSVMRELGQISLVDPTDVAQFADRMHLLLHDEELRKVYTRWAARYIEQFDYKIVTAQYVTLYEQVLEHSKQSPTLTRRTRTARKRLSYDIEA